MKHLYVAVAAAVAVTFFSGCPAWAEDPPSAPSAEPIYGRELMTEQEIATQRQRMREAKTEEERVRIRAEHHVAMQERARERGVEIPAAMPPDAGHKGQGLGLGRGQGKGLGQGQGGGKGQGDGKGRGQGQQAKPVAPDADAPEHRDGPYGDKQKSKRPGKGG